MSDADYAALYKDKLAEWDAVYPIGPDSRLLGQGGEDRGKTVRAAHGRRAAAR